MFCIMWPQNGSMNSELTNPLTEMSGSSGAWYATSICVLPFSSESCSYSVVVERGTSYFAILELTASCVDC